MGGDNVNEGWIVGDAAERDAKMVVFIAPGIVVILDYVVQLMRCHDVALLHFIETPDVLGRTGPRHDHGNEDANGDQQ